MHLSFTRDKKQLEYNIRRKNVYRQQLSYQLHKLARYAKR